MDEKEEENEATTNKARAIKNIVYAMEPALICEHILGIFRFSKLNGNIVPTNGMRKLIGLLISSAFIITFLSSLIYTNYKTYFSISLDSTSKLMEAFSVLPSVVVIAEYFTAVITTSFFHSNTTLRIVEAFAEIDMSLNASIHENFYNMCYRHAAKHIMLILIIHAIFGSADLLTDENFYIYKVLSIIIYTQQDLEVFFFCKFVAMVNVRLNIINDLLSKFIQDHTNKSSIFTVEERGNMTGKTFNFIGHISEDNVKIKDLAATYDLLGDTSSKINDVFNFQIFMNLASTFTYIVITIWTSLYYFSGYFRGPSVPTGQLTTVHIWCFLTVMSVAITSWRCERLRTTRHQTKILVNELIMDHDLPKSMRLQAKVFMELIEAWPLRIFVYDMFSVDITLMLKFISVATTYLIVVIQISHFV